MVIFMEKVSFIYLKCWFFKDSLNEKLLNNFKYVILSIWIELFFCVVSK